MAEVMKRAELVQVGECVVNYDAAHYDYADVERTQRVLEWLPITRIECEGDVFTFWTARDKRVLHGSQLMRVRQFDVRLFSQMLEALHIAADALDNYSDVNDGEDGRPVANCAMSALRDVNAAIAKAEGR